MDKKLKRLAEVLGVSYQNLKTAMEVVEKEEDEKFEAEQTAAETKADEEITTSDEDLTDGAPVV